MIFKQNFVSCSLRKDDKYLSYHISLCNWFDYRYAYAIIHISSCASTLLSVIKEWIRPGSIILSDYWKAYDCLDQHDYVHLKVNHSLHFKDRETNVHTNSIESSWRAAKSICTSSGRKKAHIPGNLAKYMFFKHCNECKLNPTIEFLRLAGSLYDATKPSPVPPVDEEVDDDDVCSDVDWRQDSALLCTKLVYHMISI